MQLLSKQDPWLVAEENHHMYLKLMIDGMPSRPFSAMTIRAQQ